MADAPKQEGLDERFARHIRQSRYEQIQDADAESVACSLPLAGEDPQTIPGDGLTGGAAIKFGQVDAAGEPDFYDTHNFAQPPAAELAIPYSGIYLARVIVVWDDVGAGLRQFDLYSSAGGMLQFNDTAPGGDFFTITEWDWGYLNEGPATVRASHDEISGLNVVNAQVKLVLLAGLELTSTIIG